MTNVSKRFAGALGRLWGSAYLLLSLAVLFWAGNSVVGRAASGVIPPLALTFWRFGVALLVILPVAWPHLRRDAAQIRRAWKILVLLGLTGVAAFPSLLYWGLQFTTALNSVLLQAAIPPLVLLVSFLVYGERASVGQLGGVALLGAGRAGQFVHLMPVFGAVLAVLLLHEKLELFHLFGVALIAAGIGLSSLGRKPLAVEAAEPIEEP